MKVHKGNFCLILLLVLLAVACIKYQNTTIIRELTPDTRELIGRWENINAYTDGLRRIVITSQEPGQLSIHLWRACDRSACYLGVRSRELQGIQNGRFPIDVEWEGQSIQLELRLTGEGKLVASALSGTGNFESQYFSMTRTRTLYQQVDFEDVRAVYLSRSHIEGSPEGDNHLTPGSIIAFQTEEGRFGKLQVRGNDNLFTIRWMCWTAQGTVYGESNYLPVRGNAYFDLDLGEGHGKTMHPSSDFFWGDKAPKKRWLEPVNGAVFAVFHLE